MPKFQSLDSSKAEIAASVLADIERTPPDCRYNSNKLGGWLRALGVPMMGYHSNNRAAEALTHLMFAIGSVSGKNAESPEPLVSLDTESRMVDTLRAEADKVRADVDLSEMGWHDLRKKASDLGVENVKALSRAEIETAIMDILTKPK